MMDELKKEIAELKGLVSKLLELQMFDHKMKYAYLDRSLNGKTQIVSKEDIEYLKKISNENINDFVSS